MDIDSLVDEILRRVQEKLREAEEAARRQPVQSQETKAEAVLLKRVLTEQDMISVCTPGLAVLHVLRRAILTDLAKDYAKARRVKVILDR